jgi:hypothetical protein
MAKTTKDKLLKAVDALIAEGRTVLASKYEFKNIAAAPQVDTQLQAKWRAGCLNLMRLLGKHAEPWQHVFNNEHVRYSVARTMAGTLEGIKQALESDLLVTVEDLVFAEAFSDLLEQADYLLSEGYWLAAGVLGRAVLEEHLRKWCDKEGCAPNVPKPTMNNYHTELQKAGHLNKIDAQHVLAMAAVGNTAAHNKPGLTAQDVERLLRDVREFLVRHPLS